jgi:hypothetical protein
MGERLRSVVLGAIGSIGSSSLMGILGDVLVAGLIAFMGGILGYLGNEAAKKIFSKKQKHAIKK